MRNAPDRTMLKVVIHNGQWAVEHDGDHFGHTSDKEVAKATAHKRARAMQDDGHPCQVRVSGEHGYAAL